MTWTLILAHFIGDYALQSNRMVKAKQKMRGLFVHIGIHTAVMFLLTWGIWDKVYGYLLLISGVHFLIDYGKGLVSRRWPKWIITPYFMDQVFHFLTIFGVVRLMDPAIVPPLAGPWQKFLLALILVTQVWFITERILFYQEQDYIENINARPIQRSLVRIFVMIAGYLLLSGGVEGVAFAAAVGIQVYSNKKYRGREISLDIGIGILATLVLFLPY